jgi:hypothetical protein
MALAVPEDIQALERALNEVERDARAVASALSEDLGGWRARPGSWSVAECLDHLATANTVYLGAMEAAAERALREGRQRRGPARPGLLGGLFVRSLEPPVRRRRFMVKAPKAIRPRESPPLHDAIARFLASHERARGFLLSYAGIDLTGTRFDNPFVRGVRFSLATGLHVIAAHERRHVWQAWNVRRAAERATSGTG